MKKGSFNSEHKTVIREHWNKPLIKFLSRQINDRLIYMGLPSAHAEDLEHWIDFIKEVIAFQCREYGKPSDSAQSRTEIETLEEFLRKLERERKLDNFNVYDGYLEEVVLRGYDNSSNTVKFEQNSLITLYNLDFCNDIASPIEYVDRNGDTRKVYKFNAIKKLLEIQQQISDISDKFLFLLTIHCSYNGAELQHFLNTPPDDQIADYLARYRALSGHEKNARIIRLFVCYQIYKYFPAYNFSHQILPVIKYNGLNGTPLLHFVVLGMQPAPSAEGVPVFQNLNEILDQKFITIQAEAFVNLDSVLEEKNVDELDPIKLFTHSKTYQKLWA